MGKTKAWINAFRLRTLPLALSSIIVGGFISVSFNKFSWIVTILAAFTTVLLTILSNLANDYGDSKSGIDNDARVGPTRAVQSGEISLSQMKVGIIAFIVLSLVSGSFLIYFGTIGVSFIAGMVFFIIGLTSIYAAINYTVGKNPYGYMGFGDLFVLIFFGLAGVLGTFYLNTQILDYQVLLPALSIGFLCVAMLNLNNMRDIENDRASGKRTLVVLIGSRNAKIYHLLLVLLPFILCTFYVILNYNRPLQFLFLLSLPLFITDLNSIIKNTEPELYDPYLKKQALKTLLFSIIFGLGLII